MWEVLGDTIFYNRRTLANHPVLPPYAKKNYLRIQLVDIKIYCIPPGKIKDKAKAVTFKKVFQTNSNKTRSSWMLMNKWNIETFVSESSKLPQRLPAHVRGPPHYLNGASEDNATSNLYDSATDQVGNLKTTQPSKHSTSDKYSALILKKVISYPTFFSKL